MEQVLKCLRAVSDESRARIVMLLLKQELSVCELMAILRISQPLVSRHLSVLKEAGLAKVRRAGKLHFYSVSEEAQSGGKAGFVKLLADTLKSDATVKIDELRRQKCNEYQKETGECTIESLNRFAMQEVKA
jgi:ArsR family transcriptional regulator